MDCRENVKAGLAFQKPHLPAAEAEMRIDMLLERVGLGGQDRRPAADLTYIDHKRLELARALARSRGCCCSTNGSPGSIRPNCTIGIDLIRSLKADGITIVLVEHVMDAIRSLCDRCVVMSSGRKIAEGATADVLADAAVVKAYLGGVAADA